MNIAIDISPLTTGHYLKHRVRGTGFYLENLQKSLKKYFPQHTYMSFHQGLQEPKNADLLHYPYFEPFFLTLPLLKRKKRVVTVHDLTPLVFPKHFPPGIKGNIRWWIQKKALAGSDAIITDSESSKKDIISFVGVPTTKVHTIYLAAGEEFGQVDKRKAKSALQDKYGLPDKFALYVGDATWNKNLPNLIKAIKKTAIPLVMTGKTLVDTTIDLNNSWNRDLVEVQQLVKEDRHIVRLGFVPIDDLINLYNVATVFVMPSLYEGFGLPVLEAMQSGCPVVTSRNGSIPEIAQDSAYYVDADNDESIAEGISTVFHSEKLRHTLSEKGLGQAALFSWKKCASQTLDVYKAVLKTS